MTGWFKVPWKERNGSPQLLKDMSVPCAVKVQAKGEESSEPLLLEAYCWRSKAVRECCAIALLSTV